MALLLHLCQQEVLDAQHLQEMLAGAVTCHCWGVSAPRLACRALESHEVHSYATVAAPGR